MWRTIIGVLLLTIVAGFAAPELAEARITRIQITRVESPTFEGTSFGAVGQYEKLVGRAYGEVDPTDSRNAIITDLGLAPTNAVGKVEYSTGIFILRPIDRSIGNRRVLYEVNNRATFSRWPSSTTACARTNPRRRPTLATVSLCARATRSCRAAGTLRCRLATTASR